jgi:hypothetical protein
MTDRSQPEKFKGDDASPLDSTPRRVLNIDDTVLKFGIAISFLIFCAVTTYVLTGSWLPIRK